jgi:hypothetical protein
LTFLLKCELVEVLLNDEYPRIQGGVIIRHRGQVPPTFHELCRMKRACIPVHNILILYIFLTSLRVVSLSNHESRSPVVNSSGMTDLKYDDAVLSAWMMEA